ncbi:MAG: DUF4097 family beta strand repeat protein [Bdellovibrionales bacterium]|nr:DUF4097 family beta strand repeat protein [Bdellovibrionales bacterium]
MSLRALTLASFIVGVMGLSASGFLVAQNPKVLQKLWPNVEFNGSFTSWEPKEFKESNSFPLKDLEDVSIYVQSEDLDVVVEERKDIWVEVQGTFATPAGAKNRVKATRAEIANQRLTLTFFQSTDPSGNIHIDNMDDLVKFFWQGKSFEAKVKVHVPKEIKTIELSSVSGDVKVAGANVKKLKLNTISGDIEWTPLKAEEVSIDSVSGDVAGELEVVDLKGSFVSGDAHLDLRSQKPQMNLSSISGDLRLKFLPETQALFKLSTTSGDLRVDKTETEDDELEVTVGKGDGRVRVETVSGDVDIDLTL